MSILVLSTADKQLIGKAVAGHMDSEVSDKDLFLFAYKAYKSVNKKQRGSITGILNKEVERVTKSTNVGNTIKRVFKMAFNYLDMAVICNFDKLEYTNISNLVKLFKYVDKHQSEESINLRQEIKDVLSEGVSDLRYNNNMANTITNLKEKYKLVETDGEFKVAEYMNIVKSGISKLNEAELLELMDSMADRLDELEESRLEEVA